MTVMPLTNMGRYSAMDSSFSDDIHRAGEMLIAAIRSETKLAALPNATSATLGEAYAVQNAIVDMEGPVGGWKVSPLRADGEPRCSPIPATFFVSSPAIFKSEFLSLYQAELEIAVRLGSHLLPRNGQPSVNEVAASIAAIHPSIELLSSRFTVDSAASEFHRIADLQNCARVVIGKGLTDWRKLEFSDLSLNMALDGTFQHAAPLQPSTERTLAAIGWLATHAEQRGRPLKSGDIIITGARLGPFAVGLSSSVAAGAGLLGTVTVSRC